MRDHTKLDVFWLADELALRVYSLTLSYPKAEMFGLTSQMRRSAVSVASNIVEGSARNGERDYLRFLDIAYASTRELQYHLSLARRLGFGVADVHKAAERLALRTSTGLCALIGRLRSDS